MDKKSTYLIIGGGRLAKHLRVYFDSLGVDYALWNRASKTSVESLVEQCEKILLAVSDDAIEEFADKLKPRLTEDQVIIHFSGALEIQGAESVHPLMTFGTDLYTSDFYKTIPFVTVKGKKSFKELFPEFPNPFYEIDAGDKSYYHALCAISGNFPVVLWNAVSEKFEKELKLPKSILQPYLNRVLENFISSDNSLTGPFARKDKLTIKKHIEVLERSDLKELYEAFYRYYFNGNKEEKINENYK